MSVSQQQQQHVVGSGRLAKMLGCRVPIMLAGMGGVSYSNLVAAVSEAGG